MVNHVSGDEPILLVVVVPPRIQVAVEVREGAARHLDADAMSGGEHVAGDEGRDREFVDLAGLHENWLVPSLAPPGAENAVVEVEGFPVRPDVHELDRKVGVTSTRSASGAEVYTRTSLRISIAVWSNDPLGLKPAGSGCIGSYTKASDAPLAGLVVVSLPLPNKLFAPPSLSR